MNGSRVAPVSSTQIAFVSVNSRTASWPISSWACAGVAPRESQASTSSRRAREVRQKLRPLKVAALMLLPITIPATADAPEALVCASKLAGDEAVFLWYAGDPDQRYLALQAALDKAKYVRGGPNWVAGGMLDPAMGEGARATAPLAGLWYFVFVLPMFLLTPDAATREPIGRAVRDAVGDLVGTFREARARKPLFRFLLARMAYQDGVNALLVLGGGRGVPAQVVLGGKVALGGVQLVAPGLE